MKADRSPRPAPVHIGISGWTYAPWRGHFYPPGLPAAQELAFAASAFASIEVNGTFYRLQTPETFIRWAQETPNDFIFSIKGPRFITHVKRLREVEAPLANFLASGLFALGPKLGPLLWQLPPNFRFEPERMAAFLDLLPQDGDKAEALARRHDARVEGRALLKVPQGTRFRHAVEIRHESFLVPAFLDLLRARNMAFVIADTVDWPCRMDLTADFVFCRLHGSEELYRSRYRPEALDRWAARIRAWRSGAGIAEGAYVDREKTEPGRRPVFLYFDNTDKRHAPEDARALVERLR